MSTIENQQMNKRAREGEEIETHKEEDKAILTHSRVLQYHVKLSTNVPIQDNAAPGDINDSTATCNEQVTGKMKVSLTSKPIFIHAAARFPSRSLYWPLQITFFKMRASQGAPLHKQQNANSELPKGISGTVSNPTKKVKLSTCIYMPLVAALHHLSNAETRPAVFRWHASNIA